jgi:hypothetical protein
MEKNIGVEARTLTVKRRMKARTAETRSIWQLNIVLCKLCSHCNRQRPEDLRFSQWCCWTLHTCSENLGATWILSTPEGRDEARFMLIYKYWVSPDKIQPPWRPTRLVKCKCKTW